MKRFIYIGKFKKQLNDNYNDKCPYLKSLQTKRQHEFQNIEKIRNDIISDKVLKDDEIYQRDYSFFSFVKPGYKEIKKLPKIKIYPGFKYTFKSPAEKYHSYKINKLNEYDKIYKNSLIFFPRAIRAYIMNRSNSAANLPIIH